MTFIRLCLVTVTLCVSCGGSSFQSASGGDSGAAGGGGTAAGGTANGGSAGVSGSAGNGGSPSGGSAGAATGGAAGSSAGAGGSGTTECERLRTEYAAALEKARGCDSGSTDQCSTSSTLPSLGCGCPVLVNSKSEFTNVAKQKYQAFQDAMCDAGPVCNIACLEPVSATCAAQKTAAGTVYQCAGALPVAN
jgi:hypothetical protein